LKALILTLTLTIAAISANAASICTEMNPTAGAGKKWSVIAAGQTAILKAGNQQVAVLKLDSSKSTRGPQESPSSKTYSQPNGYEIVLSTGGIVGPSATLYSNGVAGLQKLADLVLCR
jgi:hypothetical protein